MARDTSSAERDESYWDNVVEEITQNEPTDAALWRKASSRGPTCVSCADRSIDRWLIRCGGGNAKKSCPRWYHPSCAFKDPKVFVHGVERSHEGGGPPPLPSILVTCAEHYDPPRYCKCRKTDGEVVDGSIECAKCKDWWHYRCAGINANNVPDVFNCERCLRRLKRGEPIPEAEIRANLAKLEDYTRQRFAQKVEGVRVFIAEATALLSGSQASQEGGYVELAALLERSEQLAATAASGIKDASTEEGEDDEGGVPIPEGIRARHDHVVARLHQASEAADALEEKIDDWKRRHQEGFYRTDGGGRGGWAVTPEELAAQTEELEGLAEEVDGSFVPAAAALWVKKQLALVRWVQDALALTGGGPDAPSPEADEIAKLQARSSDLNVANKRRGYAAVDHIDALARSAATWRKRAVTLLDRMKSSGPPGGGSGSGSGVDLDTLERCVAAGQALPVHVPEMEPLTAALVVWTGWGQRAGKVQQPAEVVALAAEAAGYAMHITSSLLDSVTKRAAAITWEESATKAIHAANTAAARNAGDDAVPARVTLAEATVLVEQGSRLQLSAEKEAILHQLRSLAASAEDASNAALLARARAVLEAEGGDAASANDADDEAAEEQSVQAVLSELAAVPVVHPEEEALRRRLRALRWQQRASETLEFAEASLKDLEALSAEAQEIGAEAKNMAINLTLTDRLMHVGRWRRKAAAIIASAASAGGDGRAAEAQDLLSAAANLHVARESISEAAELERLLAAGDAWMKGFVGAFGPSGELWPPLDAAKELVDSVGALLVPASVAEAVRWWYSAADALQMVAANSGAAAAYNPLLEEGEGLLARLGGSDATEGTAAATGLVERAMPSLRVRVWCATVAALLAGQAPPLPLYDAEALMEHASAMVPSAPDLETSPEFAGLRQSITVVRQAEAAASAVIAATAPLPAPPSAASEGAADASAVAAWSEALERARAALSEVRDQLKDAAAAGIANEQRERLSARCSLCEWMRRIAGCGVLDGRMVPASELEQLASEASKAAAAALPDENSVVAAASNRLTDLYGSLTSLRHELAGMSQWPAGKVQGSQAAGDKLLTREDLAKMLAAPVFDSVEASQDRERISALSDAATQFEGVARALVLRVPSEDRAVALAALPEVGAAAGLAQAADTEAWLSAAIASVEEKGLPERLWAVALLRWAKRACDAAAAASAAETAGSRGGAALRAAAADAIAISRDRGVLLASAGSTVALSSWLSKRLERLERLKALADGVKAWSAAVLERFSSMLTEKDGEVQLVVSGVGAVSAADLASAISAGRALALVRAIEPGRSVLKALTRALVMHQPDHPLVPASQQGQARPPPSKTAAAKASQKRKATARDDAGSATETENEEEHNSMDEEERTEEGEDQPPRKAFSAAVEAGGRRAAAASARSRMRGWTQALNVGGPAPQKQQAGDDGDEAFVPRISSTSSGGGNNGASAGGGATRSAVGMQRQSSASPRVIAAPTPPAPPPRQRLGPCGRLGCPFQCRQRSIFCSDRCANISGKARLATLVAHKREAALAFEGDNLGALAIRGPVEVAAAATMKRAALAQGAPPLQTILGSAAGPDTAAGATGAAADLMQLDQLLSAAGGLLPAVLVDADNQPGATSGAAAAQRAVSSPNAGGGAASSVYTAEMGAALGRLLAKVGGGNEKMARLRARVRQRFGEVFDAATQRLGTSDAQTEEALAAAFAFEIERRVADMRPLRDPKNLEDYKAKVRSLRFNVSLDRNAELLCDVLAGRVDGEALCGMTDDQLASRKQQEMRKKVRQESVHDHWRRGGAEKDGQAVVFKDGDFVALKDLREQAVRAPGAAPVAKAEGAQRRALAAQPIELGKPEQRQTKKPKLEATSSVDKKRRSDKDGGEKPKRVKTEAPSDGKAAVPTDLKAAAAGRAAAVTTAGEGADKPVPTGPTVRDVMAATAAQAAAADAPSMPPTPPQAFPSPPRYDEDDDPGQQHLLEEEEVEGRSANHNKLSDPGEADDGPAPMDEEELVNGRLGGDGKGGLALRAASPPPPRADTGEGAPRRSGTSAGGTFSQVVPSDGGNSTSFKMIFPQLAAFRCKLWAPPTESVALQGLLPSILHVVGTMPPSYARQLWQDKEIRRGGHRMAVVAIKAGAKESENNKACMELCDHMANRKGGRVGYVRHENDPSLGISRLVEMWLVPPALSHLVPEVAGIGLADQFMTGVIAYIDEDHEDQQQLLNRPTEPTLPIPLDQRRQQQQQLQAMATETPPPPPAALLGSMQPGGYTSGSGGSPYEASTPDSQLVPAAAAGAAAAPPAAEGAAAEDEISSPGGHVLSAKREAAAAAASPLRVQELKAPQRLDMLEGREVPSAGTKSPPPPPPPPPPPKIPPLPPKLPPQLPPQVALAHAPVYAPRNVLNYPPTYPVAPTHEAMMQLAQEVVSRGPSEVQTLRAAPNGRQLYSFLYADDPGWEGFRRIMQGLLSMPNPASQTAPVYTMQQVGSDGGVSGVHSSGSRWT